MSIAQEGRGKNRRNARRVVVCGGRRFSNFRMLKSVLDQLGRDIVIIHGAAQGADTTAGHWAQSQGVCEIRVPAQWRYYDRMAGPIRNQWMLDYLRPDLVIAFPGGRGTAHMIASAKSAGIEVVSVDPKSLDGARLRLQELFGNGLQGCLSIE